MINKPLAIRRVRIAVSLFFGLLTVALCVLWVRSYVTFDRIVYHNGEHGALTGKDAVMFLSFRGSFTVVLLQPCYVFIPYWDTGPAHIDPQFTSLPWEGPTYLGFALLHNSQFNAMPNDAGAYPGLSLIARSYTDNVNGLIMPYCALTGLALATSMLAIFAHSPSLRFSLRTLLIATTLMAAVLGMTAWLARQGLTK